MADARFAKPIDEKLVRDLVKNHRMIITIEEGSSNGFGAFVLQFLAREGLLDTGKVKIRTLHLPDIFQDHDNPQKQYDLAGLNAKHIAETALTA